MTDATAAPLPPALPAPQPQRALGLRTYLLAGCSIGGTLCASLAANSDVNLVFVIASAVFGAVFVLLTAAPAAPAPAPMMQAPASMAASGSTAAVSPVPAAPVAPAANPGLGGSIGIGVVAAVLSFIMNQIAQVAFGFVAFNLVADELTADQLVYITTFIGIGVVMVKTPFDVFIGAFHLSRARNILVGLGLFALTYFLCYVIEQMISAAVGASGLFTTVSTYGLEGLMWGMFYVIGLPTIAQAVGAFGVRLAPRRPPTLRRSPRASCRCSHSSPRGSRTGRSASRSGSRP